MDARGRDRVATKGDGLNPRATDFVQRDSATLLCAEQGGIENALNLSTIFKIRAAFRSGGHRLDELPGHPPLLAEGFFVKLLDVFPAFSIPKQFRDFNLAQ